MWPLLWRPWLPKIGRGGPAVEVQFRVFLLYFLCTLTTYFYRVFGKCSSSEMFYTLQTFKKYNFVLCPNFHCTFGIHWMLQLQWMYSLQCFTVLPLHCIFAVCICSVLLEKVLLHLGGFCCHNTLFQLFSALLTFFFPISNKIYRRFLLFADLGGMAPAVRRNEIKSAWPHKHA